MLTNLKTKLAVLKSLPVRLVVSIAIAFAVQFSFGPDLARLTKETQTNKNQRTKPEEQPSGLIKFYEAYSWPIYFGSLCFVGLYYLAGWLNQPDSKKEPNT